MCAYLFKAIDRLNSGKIQNFQFQAEIVIFRGKITKMANFPVFTKSKLRRFVLKRLGMFCRVIELDIDWNGLGGWSKGEIPYCEL